MTYSAMPPPSGDFRIARVLGRSFELLSRDFVRFYLIAAIISLPLPLFRVYGAPYLVDLQLAPYRNGSRVGTAIAVVIGWAVLSVVVAILGQATMLYGAVQQMRGRSFGIGESLSRGLARFLPIIGLLILTVLAIGAVAVVAFFAAGMFAGGFYAWNLLGALIPFALAGLAAAVAFFMLSARWYVSLPVCVIEREGPVASLGRSTFLTSGFRWPIFGMYFLLLVAAVIAERALAAVLAPIMPGGAAPFGLFLLQSLISAYQAIVVAVAYHDLRVAKEGIDIERVAEVFD